MSRRRNQRRRKVTRQFPQKAQEEVYCSSSLRFLRSMDMKFKTRLFLILFVAGMVGILSFLLVDLEAVLKLVPAPAGAEVPAVTPALKLLSLVQPTILLIVAVLIGIALAPKVGLSAPMAEALAAGGRWLPALKPQVVPGILGGLVAGIGIVIPSVVFKPFISIQALERIEKFTNLVPMATRLLYGGIIEELLLRWGLMTLIVWIAWRVLQRRSPKPASVSFVLAILLSSVIFALGHLPVASIAVGLTVALTLFVIVGNSIFGIVAGYLYWKRGLETAIIAHMFCHVVLALAFYAGAYF